MTLTDDGLDSATWNFVARCASASHSRDTEQFVATLRELDDLPPDNKVLPYLIYLISQQIWHLAPDKLTPEHIRGIAEDIYPDFNNMTYVDLDGLESLLLATFGKPDYLNQVVDVSFVGLLAIAAGLLFTDVDSDMERIRPKLVDWCKRAQDAGPNPK
ncbi:hypothetical protein G4X40_07055 [Rhodococcus sp. D2-41]|uniref:hypothetical protein n=1 Tax=Speluncibacter jeojiensis TaxID=2710754 RepID=UPI00240FBE6A|nr:hypothetical protein [Rhodococcus sp. D2-41]MDG3009904.1 hypothetical protein [Rhodococcus sp. D2-41]